MSELNFLSLSEDQISDVKHCIGMYGKHKPYHRHGKSFYVPWRNYFNTNIDNPFWSDLCEKGYADHGEVRLHEQFGGLKTTFFWLTDNGRDWFGNIIGATIKEESD